MNLNKVFLYYILIIFISINVKMRYTWPHLHVFRQIRIGYWCDGMKLAKDFLFGIRLDLLLFVAGRKLSEQLD